MLSVNAGNPFEYITSSIGEVIGKYSLQSSNIAKKLHAVALPVIILVGLASMLAADAEMFYNTPRDCRNMCDGYFQKPPSEFCTWFCRSS